MSRDPNRKERAGSMRDGERDLGSAGSGSAPRDGYTVKARRPRVRYFDESVPLDRADRIEGMLRDWPPIPDYGDY